MRLVKYILSLQKSSHEYYIYSYSHPVEIIRLQALYCKDNKKKFSSLHDYIS